MTHRSVLEWDRVAVGEDGFTRAQADQLLGEARTHQLGGMDGAAILTDHHRWLRAQQVVGVLAAQDCSLEILPKIEALGDGQTLEARARLRRTLVHMIDVALGLDIDLGRETAIARQNETLLEILIRAFADKLTGTVRRGLPRQYLSCEDDLPVLRGRLDVTRQFTTLAVRGDRLACRFDILSTDIPLLQIMKACVVLLMRFARRGDTRQRLAELRFALADIADVPPRSLRWDKVCLDRSNLRWRSLLQMSRLFLGRNFQATHRAEAPGGPAGLTLLFPMHTLFEAYVAAMLRAALTPHGYEVVAQGGLRHCLIELGPDGAPGRGLFQTKPDCLIRRDGRIVVVVDAKWKRLAPAIEDPKRNIAQGDVYQLMTYARLYGCPRVLLLYPFHEGLEARGALAKGRFNDAEGREHLEIGTLDLAADRAETLRALRRLVGVDGAVPAEAAI